jgi:hypothetical protein
MLYPLSYERSHCSILHSERSPGALTAHARAHSGDRASDLLILNGLNLMVMSVFVGPPTTRRSLPGTKGGDGFD